MVRDEAYYNSVTEQIIGCSYKVANILGAGFLEKVYENALAYELEKSGLTVVIQKPVQVYYDGHLVGDYVVDLLVNDEIIVELKAIKKIDEIHIAQCLNYLKATGKKVALLINFGNSKVQVKRVVVGNG
ncbi:GxxExxY protein [Desulfuromonas sp. CSMB_57]|uniref:GxxExxY protein n=1 Tax=Desulfuromonas sp. CSMB_57 TaxID=2807629 RepID=UPI001CD4584D|nr:GxxExxY protein [Desulfuromonas sp. CSMB_57]